MLMRMMQKANMMSGDADRAYWEEINNKLENAKSFCLNEEENEENSSSEEGEELTETVEQAIEEETD